MATIGDPFEAIFDRLQYDFCEDDNEILGNWKFKREGDVITITYMPYENNESPYPPVTATYRVIRLTHEEGFMTDA